MYDLRTNLLLISGLVLSLFIHSFGSAKAYDFFSLVNSVEEAVDKPEDDTAKLEKQEKARSVIGRAKEEKVMNANWLSYEDFEKLMTQKEKIDQATTQTKVDPEEVKRAPLEPSPIAMNSKASPTAPAGKPVKPSPQVVQKTPEKPVEAVKAEVKPRTNPSPDKTETSNTKTTNPQPTTVAMLDKKADATLPEIEKEDSGVPQEAVGDKNPEPKAVSPDAKPDKAVKPSPEKEAKKEKTAVAAKAGTKSQEQPNEDSKSNPTAAAKTKSESPPSTRVKYATFKNGKVEGPKGVAVDTVNPRFSMAALIASAPKNPTVYIKFNEKGEVETAKITKTSGYANVDGPILTAVYKWKAEGFEGDHYIIENMNFILD